MNRRKFLKLLGVLLIALPFVEWRQRCDIVTDEHIVYFNTTTDGQTKFWHDTEAITRVVYPIDPETAEGFQGSTLRIWAE